MPGTLAVELHTDSDTPEDRALLPPALVAAVFEPAEPEMVNWRALRGAELARLAMQRRSAVGRS